MYKDKEQAKEAARERKRRQRAKGVTVTPNENVTPSVTPTRVTPSDDVTPIVTPFINNLRSCPGSPPGHLAEWLKDRAGRLKLHAIYQALKNRELQNEVRLGVYGPTFGELGEVLEETAVLDSV